MLNDNKRKVSVGWQLVKQLLQRFQSARGSSDAHDRSEWLLLVVGRIRSRRVIKCHWIAYLFKTAGGIESGLFTGNGLPMIAAESEQRRGLFDRLDAQSLRFLQPKRTRTIGSIRMIGVSAGGLEPSQKVR